MKHSKLIIAFVAGAALTLLFRHGLSFLQLPAWLEKEPGIVSTLIFLGLVLAVAFGSRVLGGETQVETGPDGASLLKKFFHFLKNLRTSENDSWIGGVCGGLAQQTPVPAWLWRLGFVCLSLGYGSGVPVYVLLWIFVPLEEANHKTPA